MHSKDKIIINYINYQGYKYSLAWNYDYKTDHETNEQTLATITNYCLDNAYLLNKQLKRDLKHQDTSTMTIENHNLIIQKGQVVSDFKKLGDPHLVVTINSQNRTINFDDQQNRVINTKPIETIFNKIKFANNCQSQFVEHEFSLLSNQKRDTFEQLQDSIPVSGLDAIQKLRNLVDSGLDWKQLFYHSGTKVDYKINNIEPKSMVISYATILENLTGLKIFASTDYDNNIEQDLIIKNFLEPTTLAEVKVNIANLMTNKKRINHEIEIRECELKQTHLENTYQEYKVEKSQYLVGVDQKHLSGKELEQFNKNQELMLDFEKVKEQEIKEVTKNLHKLLSQNHDLWKEKIFSNLKATQVAAQSKPKTAVVKPTKITKVKTKKADTKKKTAPTPEQEKSKDTTKVPTAIVKPLTTPTKDITQPKPTTSNIYVATSFKQKASQSDKSVLMKINDEQAVWIPKTAITPKLKDFTKEELAKIALGEKITQQQTKGTYNIEINPNQNYQVYKLETDDNKHHVKTTTVLNGYLLANNLTQYHKEVIKRFLAEKQREQTTDKFKNQEQSKIKYHELNID